jgi:hypothetical protein
MFYIYRNLHRGLAFSVRENGRVIDRLIDFVAYDVRFKVSERGRERVLREKRKNVHAFVVVQRYSVATVDVSDMMPVTYNPYKAGTFMCGDRPISTASAVAFSGGRCYLML